MTQKLRDGFEFNKKACFVCGSFNHLIKDCNFYENKMVGKSMLNNMGRVTGQREVKPVWNNAQRVNHQNKLTHSHPKRNFVPTAVATKCRLVPVNVAKQSSPRAATLISTAKHVNTAAIKQKFNNVTTAGIEVVVSTAEEKRENIVKSSACWIWRPTEKVIDHISKDSGSYMPKDLTMLILKADSRISDSGCSRHMTGNKSYLTDYQDIDGGFIAFAGSPKGDELKLILFSSHKCVTRKIVILFTEICCIVLSPDFKLLDESQVLLKVPRQNNMYSFDLKNVVPSGGLTCLFAKATIDESNLWHRRLGHINFKTMNKLVRGNLVRGLPLKLFENDHTCVACQKGKQHKASCKTKLVSSISQPLQMLHMDLFGPTFVRSINHKIYCLVVTDDFSRFSWVFFLATKDETSGILKTFITGIENQINQKVKIIRCDNGTEFKNNDMNQFYGMKGIKREFSVARTPQQNRVAERKNRTLIEAARTMLSDSFLPTTFWAEAVNTACYVQNRVLVTKPHNKTPYELLHGPQCSGDAVADDTNSSGGRAMKEELLQFRLQKMDVMSVFLYGTIEEEVYVCQPPGFEDLQFPNKVYKVEKALYGLHQAPRAWYETLSTYLLENRLRIGTIDKTLFIKKDKGDILLVQVYVEDIFFGSTKKSLCVEFEQMMHKRFQMSSIGELTFFLGLQVKQKDDGIFISQDKYVADI
ncbi:putative ribonuclease H-like domain-containing protein [Tanacetum coccineum]